MKIIKLLILSFFALGMIINSAFAGGKLVIASNASDAAPRQAMEDIVAKFQAANPDIEVVLNTTEHEAFKTAIRTILAADKGPDVATWFAGNRMAGFVADGLFADVSDVWASEGWGNSMSSTMPSVTFNGKQYAVPFSYYQWGVYYRKDIFDANGISVPTTWDEFVAACATLKAAGITPITIGSKYLWTTAGVFDYLNLRTNGYEFHMALTKGEVPYTDPKVHAVFDKWDELVKPGYFLENHASLAWQEAIPPMVNGEAAMYVMGNFSVALFKEGGLTNDNLGFFQFPEITPGVPMAEEAPTDTMHIASGAKNKIDAKRFLIFLSRADVQEEMNKTLGQLPVNSGSKVDPDPFLEAGLNMLNNAYAMAQFYDRDAPAEMASEGMKGFQEYMVNPDRRDKILERLEKVRQRVYK